jgi:hypothetical protein
MRLAGLHALRASPCFSGRTGKLLLLPLPSVTTKMRTLALGREKT